MNSYTKSPAASNTLDGPREHEIPARINAAEEQLSCLHDTIDKLVNRLEAVMHAPSAGDEAAPAPASLTHVGDRLLTISNRTRYATERLNEVLYRLEV